MKPTMKTCPGCKVSLPLSDYNRGSEPGGVQAYCKPCGRARILRAYYKRKAKNPEGFAKVAERECAGCGVTRPASAFYARTFQPGGITSQCKACMKVTQACVRYGITRAQYDALSKVCEICGTSRMLGVDHCHKGGQVRGVLCRNCNAAIGMLKDDPALLTAAVAYLRRSPRATRR